MSAKSALSADDHAEIHNLYSLYNLCSDAGDADAYAACFTADGVLCIEGINLRVEGRTALGAFKRADAERRGQRYRRHWNGSLHLQKLADGSVRGRCYLHGYNGEAGKLPELADVGCYVDRLVLEAGNWKFAERRITMDATSFKVPA
jgi:SnoaL-like domain